MVKVVCLLFFISLFGLHIKYGSTQASTDDIDKAKLNQDCLTTTNTLRAKHGVSPFVLDQQIVASAQAWAENIAARGAFEHDPDTTYGENIFRGSSYVWAGHTAVFAMEYWYSEIANWDFENAQTKYPNDPSKMTGHFTQMVWKETVKIGCGAAINDSLKYKYIVCKYNPPGNFGYKEDYKRNVLPVV